MSAATEAVPRLAIFASEPTSSDPIAMALAVPIAATWPDCSAPNCDDVKATNWSVVNAATEAVTKLAIFSSEPISSDPIALALADPIAAT